MLILKTIGPPGSLGFLAVSIAVGLVIGYVWPKKRGIGHLWLAAILGFYLLLSWPPAAHVIIAGLSAPPTPAGPTTVELDTLIVFDGDNRRGRALAADQAVRAASPGVVHVLGSHWILESLTDAVLDRMRHHPAPANTREQVAWVARFIASPDAGRSAIVVSRLQAPRVAALAARMAPTVPIIASPLDQEPSTAGVWRFIPSYGALCASRDALYEHAALHYYRWHRWI